MADNALQELQAWFSTPQGVSLLHAEAGIVEKFVNECIPGVIDWCVSLGSVNWCEAQSMQRHVWVLPKGCTYNSHSVIQTSAHTLPFPNDSIDLVILPHVLEFSENPKAVLQEIYRVLAPDGHIVFCSFNPMSLWGLKKFLWRTAKHDVPWSGKYIGAHTLKEWLTNFDFAIRMNRNVYYRPPRKKSKHVNNMQSLEVLGRIWWPTFGGAYVMIAQKQTATLTPMRVKWNTDKIVSTNSLVNPTQRSYDEETK